MEQLEPREICEMCQILSPSLTGVLSRMEDLGLLTRTRMQEDQRRVMVRLMPKGEKLVAELSPLIIEQYRIIERAFGTELIQEVYDVMDKFIAAESGPIPQVKLPTRSNAGKKLSD
jgi:DNA-binding MarR family transcriptional regulator